MQQLAQALGLRRLLGSSTSAAVTAAAAAAAAPARPLASAAAGSEGRAKTSASASAGAAPPDTEASPDKCMATGLPLSAPPPKELRERVEQVAM